MNHPPLNLYDRDLHTALVEAVTTLEQQRPRGALFRAEGKVVSGGVDVRDAFLPLAQNADVEGGTRYFAELVELGERVHRLPFPTVFAAHGLTLTWAFELALACDLIVAGESASFGLIEATVGLTPAMGGTQRLAERVGQGRAKWFVMTAGRFGAAEMERWGAVDRWSPTARSTAPHASSPGRWPPVRRGRTPPPRRSCASSPSAAWTRRTPAPPRSPARCSAPRTCGVRWSRSSSGATGRPFTGR